MAYFADLTPYIYTDSDGLEIFNVGWLDEGNEFRVGKASRGFQTALQELCEYPIVLHRGLHCCCYCYGKAGREKRQGKPIARGNGQIRVLGANGRWYAAPTLVYHYVVDHGYLPPEEFIDAVLNGLAVGVEPNRFRRR